MDGVDELEWFTVIGYVIGAICLLYTKHHKETIRQLTDANKALEANLKAKERTISQFKDDIDMINNKLNSQKIVFEHQIAVINKELATIKEQNEHYHTESLATANRIREYRDVLVEAKQHCDLEHCAVCERIENILLK